MYIQTAEIRNRIEPVLYDSKDRALAILPTTEDEDGNRFMHVHVAITNYLKRRALGKPSLPRETARIFELIQNFNRTGKWEPTKEDWTKSLEELVADSEYDLGEYGNTHLSKLKKHVRKAIPDPPKPNYPARPMKVKRPLEPVEILPPVLPKEMMEKLRKRSI